MRASPSPAEMEAELLASSSTALVVEKVLRESAPLLLLLGVAGHVLAPVVLRSQLRIRKDLVCLRDLLEFCLLLFLLLVRSVHGQFVRVMLERKLECRG